MYKVKIVINGVLREMTINGNNALEVQQIITNMYSGVGRSRNNRYKESVKIMITSKGGKVEIIGKKVDVTADLSCIFDTLIKHIGEDETKEMIKAAYEVVIEDSESKIKKVTDKELKEVIKRDLPEDLAKILLELI